MQEIMHTFSLDKKIDIIQKDGGKHEKICRKFDKILHILMAPLTFNAITVKIDGRVVMLDKLKMGAKAHGGERAKCPGAD